MATRSTIALEYADGTVDQIYCHWDGYLDHNGAILLEHYTDPFKVQQLVELGDLSSLNNEIGTEHPFSHIGVMEGAEYDKLYGTMCTFYGRDRDETGVDARRFANFDDYKANHQYEEYEYILRQVDGKPVWFVSEYGREYKPLADALKLQEAA
jgi:hypothetical protein